MRVRLSLTLDITRAASAEEKDVRDVDLGTAYLETVENTHDFPRVGFTSREDA